MIENGFLKKVGKITPTKKMKTLILVTSLPIFFLVFARGAMVAFIFAMMYYGFVKSSPSKRLLIIILAISATYSIYNFTFQYEAILYRLKIFRGVYNSGDINIIGNGIGFVTASSFVANTRVYDNDYLRFVYETGIIGIILFLHVKKEMILLN